MQSAGLVFYGCSKSGNKYSLYAAKYASGSISYQMLYVTGATPTLVGQPTTCTAKTLADLGYVPDATTTGTATSTTGTATSTTGTGTTVVPPAALCGLTDTSATGLRTWLATPANHATADFVRHSASVTTSLDTLNHAHGYKVRVFNNAALAGSFTSGSFNATTTVHPSCSVGVVDEYANDGTTKTGSAVAIKFKTTAGADSWLFYQAEGANLALPTSETYGVGTAAAACETCHKISAFTDYAILAPN